MEPNNKKKLKVNTKILLSIIISAILVIFIILASIYLVSTKNQRLVRRSENPWNIVTKKKVGQLINSALKNPKYQENKNIVTITGKDKKTDADVEIIIVIGEKKSIALSSYKQGIQEMSLAEFITYLESYA